MFSTLVIVVLTASVVSVSCEIFPFDEFRNHPRLCQELISTIRSKLGQDSDSPEDFFNKFDFPKIDTEGLFAKDSGFPEINVEKFFKQSGSRSFDDLFEDLKSKFERSKRAINQDFYFNSTHLIDQRRRSNRHYVFHFEIGALECDKKWNFTVQLDSSVNINSIVPTGTLAEILPMDYRAKKIKFVDGPPDYRGDFEGPTFYVMEGSRCKKTGPYDNLVCWDKPSLCRGAKGDFWDNKDCINNDDVDHLCYDTESKKGKNPNSKDPQKLEVHWAEIAESIYWAGITTHEVFPNGTIRSYDATLQEWKCTQSSVEGVNFFCEPSWKPSCGGFDTKVLKTLSGFGG